MTASRPPTLEQAWQAIAERDARIAQLEATVASQATHTAGPPLRRAIVKRDGVRVGVLEETPTGTRFSYDTAYLTGPRPRALSPVLPLRPEPFERERAVLPFFANLLPEGPLLDAYCRRYRIARTDVFGLLLFAARDVAGAVEVLPDDGLEGA